MAEQLLSKMMREELSGNEAEQSPTRRLQSRAPPPLDLVGSNGAFACENRPGLHATIPLLTPLAVEAYRPIPLLTPLAGSPKPLPEAMAEGEEERGSVASQCNGWKHPAVPVAAAAEPAPRIQFLQPQCRMVHKDACIVFYDLL